MLGRPKPQRHPNRLRGLPFVLCFTPIGLHFGIILAPFCAQFKSVLASLWCPGHSQEGSPVLFRLWLPFLVLFWTPRFAFGVVSNKKTTQSKFNPKFVHFFNWFSSIMKPKMTTEILPKFFKKKKSKKQLIMQAKSPTIFVQMHYWWIVRGACSPRLPKR